MSPTLKTLFLSLFLIAIGPCLWASTPLPVFQGDCFARLAKKPTSLRTKQLTIRTPVAEDLPTIVTIFNDYESARYTWFWFGEGYWTIEKLQQKYAENAEAELRGERKDLVLQLNDAAKTVVGRCALFAGREKGSLEFGITIHKSHWGKGYAPETLQAVLDHAFNDLNAPSVWFRTEPENPQMLVQYERFGISKKIDVKDDVPEPPLYHRYHHFRITKEEWLARRR